MSSQNAEVKRFVAPTMGQALALVREELGPEAVILKSQQVKGGVEIITSLERDYHTRGVHERQDFGQKFDSDLDHAMSSDASWQSQAGIEQAAASYDSKLEINDVSTIDKNDLAAEIERAREKMMAAKKAAMEAEESEQRPVKVKKPEPVQEPAPERSVRRPEAWSEDLVQEQKLAGLRDEIADLRLLLEQQSWAATSAASSVSNQDYGAVDEASSNSRSKVHGQLQRLGLSEAIINELNMAVSHSLRLHDTWKQSLASLAKGISQADDLDVERGGCYAFVGPTGVGKSTTLAKLAAAYTMRHGAGKVALVTMDSHRVGAVEQLRSLSNILGAPLKVVSVRSSLLSILAELREFPLVLIDTAGFRHGDTQLNEQLAQLDQCPQVRRLLVMSTLSQSQHLKASIHAYKPKKGRDACVLSKLDEACSLGEAIGVLWQTKVPLAYITNGQRIPQDILKANRNDLVSSAVQLAKVAQLETQFAN
ncbi:flagellar biosynthesis protein FlhF [Agaribacterium sp. ZY112]|uniref:flagellar biosynthesis protein FlhF n=1 Tax=Agaribacterium sp. ZY112 TaxID=3233574 RepID=UPI00352593B5